LKAYSGIRAIKRATPTGKAPQIKTIIGKIPDEHEALIQGSTPVRGAHFFFFFLPFSLVKKNRKNETPPLSVYISVIICNICL
jgi:hypothetical protein